MIKMPNTGFTFAYSDTVSCGYTGTFTYVTDDAGFLQIGNDKGVTYSSTDLGAKGDYSTTITI